MFPNVSLFGIWEASDIPQIHEKRNNFYMSFTKRNSEQSLQHCWNVQKSTPSKTEKRIMWIASPWGAWAPAQLGSKSTTRSRDHVIRKRPRCFVYGEHCARLPKTIRSPSGPSDAHTSNHIPKRCLLDSIENLAILYKKPNMFEVCTKFWHWAIFGIILLIGLATGHSLNFASQLRTSVFKNSGISTSETRPHTSDDRKAELESFLETGFPIKYTDKPD